MNQEKRDARFVDRPILIRALGMAKTSPHTLESRPRPTWPLNHRSLLKQSLAVLIEGITERCGCVGIDTTSQGPQNKSRMVRKEVLVSHVLAGNIQALVCSRPGLFIDLRISNIGGADVCCSLAAPSLQPRSLFPASSSKPVRCWATCVFSSLFLLVSYIRFFFLRITRWSGGPTRRIAGQAISESRFSSTTSDFRLLRRVFTALACSCIVLAPPLTPVTLFFFFCTSILRIISRSKPANRTWRPKNASWLSTTPSELGLSPIRTPMGCGCSQSKVRGENGGSAQTRGIGDRVSR